MNAKHIIVSGGDALATTIAEELKNAGAIVVKLADTEVADTEIDLAEAGIAQAVLSSARAMTMRLISKSPCWHGKPTPKCV